MAMNCAQTAQEKPTIEPMERSTTPASSANPANAATTSGTTRNEPMMLTLLNERKRGPTQSKPTTTTAMKVNAIAPTEPVRMSRIG